MDRTVDVGVDGMYRDNNEDYPGRVQPDLSSLIDGAH